MNHANEGKIGGPSTPNDVAAIVVWYNPEAGFVENIKSYLGEIGTAIIVDNSDKDNSALLADLPSISYFCLGENIGIAAALNKGCAIAAERGWQFVMTMDQDSHFAADEIKKHITEARQLMEDSSVAIIGPDYKEENPKVFRPDFEECDTTITSGSIVRLSAWSEISGYNDALFIDYMDAEFCFRLRRKRKKIIANHGVFMNHQLGNAIIKSFCGFHIRTHNHAWIRKYYITRNLLYLRSHFKDFPRPYLLMIVVNIAKVLLMERDKMRKLRAMLAGAIDHFHGQYGKWNPDSSFKARK